MRLRQPLTAIRFPSMHPFIVNKIVFPLQEFVKRKPTFQYWDELEGSQWLSHSELGQLQLRRMAAQLTFAYYQVPYYRRLFDKLGLKPEEIGSFRDFERIPFRNCHWMSPIQIVVRASSAAGVLISIPRRISGPTSGSCGLRPRISHSRLALFSMSLTP